MPLTYPSTTLYPGPTTYPGSEPIPAGTIWLSDSFTGDQANISSRPASVGTWQGTGINESLGASSVAAKTSGGALMSASVNRSQLYYVDAVPPSADYSVSVDFIAGTLPTSSYVTVLARYIPGTNYLVEGYIINGATAYISANGSVGAGILATTPVVVPQQGETHNLELGCIGDRAFLKYDGIVIIDLHDPKIPLGAGYAGCNGSASGSYTQDNFAAKTFTQVADTSFAAFGVPL